VLDGGKSLLLALSQDLSQNRPVEARDHVKRFHELFFTLSPDKNAIESTFSAGFIFYKKFISSQDIDACVFYPSCSVYAIECIHHERRKMIAFLKISDRMMRCHPLISPGSYKINHETGKYFDPIAK
jgi:putative membrane protein insertion efficiency factor